MLAVLPEYRNAGLGRRLKLAQREDAIAKGFDLMEWTFDPMEIKNAYLNLGRLGVIVRRYAAGFLWAVVFAAAGWAADGPAVCRVVAAVRPGTALCGRGG